MMETKPVLRRAVTEITAVVALLLSLAPLALTAAPAAAAPGGPVSDDFSVSPIDFLQTWQFNSPRGDGQVTGTGTHANLEAPGGGAGFPDHDAWILGDN